MNVAIIDLGSNSARMSIFNLAKKQKLADIRRYVRLSENMGPENTLKEAPMARTLEALSGFQEQIKAHGCQKVVAVATEAVRKAKNQAEFIARVQAQCGIPLEVLNGEKESFYDFLAAKDLLFHHDGIILDVGGGSFELILVKNQELYRHFCLPLGAVVTKEQYGDERKILQVLRDAFSEIGELEAFWGAPMVTMGGAARALFLSVYSVPKTELDGVALSAKAFLDAFHKLWALDVGARAKIPAIGPDRADILISGLAPFAVLAQMLHPEKISVTGKGVRDGILQSLLDA